MAAENRLTLEQLSALVRGDQVVIETSGDFRKPRYSAGTVARIESRYLIVTTRSPRGDRYVHRFNVRDGVRIGGGQRAELVDPGTASAPSASNEARRRQLRVDAAFRDWSRHRDDVDKLRRLQAAVAAALEGLSVGAPR